MLVWDGNFFLLDEGEASVLTSLERRMVAEFDIPAQDWHAVVVDVELGRIHSFAKSLDALVTRSCLEVDLHLLDSVLETVFEFFGVHGDVELILWLTTADADGLVVAGKCVDMLGEDGAVADFAEEILCIS